MRSTIGSEPNAAMENYSGSGTIHKSILNLIAPPQAREKALRIKSENPNKSRN